MRLIHTTIGEVIEIVNCRLDVKYLIFFIMVGALVTSRYDNESSAREIYQETVTIGMAIRA